MEIYGIQESVILGSFLSTFAKVSEIITTTVAFFVSFIYQGNSIRIPYKIIYILSSVFFTSLNLTFLVKLIFLSLINIDKYLFFSSYL